MAMDSTHLIVIDHSPECAEPINSLLRNSGIIVHTNFAKTTAQAEKLIKSNHPILLIYNESAPDSVPLVKVLQLAEKYDIPSAVRFTPQDPSLLTDAMSFFSCIAINIEEDDHLIGVVKRLLRSDSSQKGIDEIQSRLDELQTRHQLLLDSSREPTAYIHEGLHSYANPAYLELLQVKSFQDLGAISLLEIMSSEDTNLKVLLREMNKGSFQQKPVPVMINTPAGSSIDAELVFYPAMYDGEDCIQMMVQKADTNAVLQGELDRLRRTDPVTGLVNRKTFLEILNQLSEQEQTETSAVLYIEADNCQDVQSRLGPSAWDDFMASFAARIKEELDPGDIAARFSDNGITVLISRKGKKPVSTATTGLTNCIESTDFTVGDHTISGSCSIGYTFLGDFSGTGDELIIQARKAFVQAALEGDCAKQYKPVLKPTESVEGDEQWVERIKFALDNQEIYSIQQSITNLEGESEGLFESKTFIREDGEDISAEKFVAVAERNDLGATLDRHVLSGLMKAIAGTGDQHIISLSTNSLMDFSFPSWLIHQLEELGVQGSQLVLQLSVPSVLDNLKPAKRLIEELKPYNCGFSLSSFDDQSQTSSLLDELAINMVKLRTDLTDGLTKNTALQDVVSNVVKAAKGNQVKVIADGIQDAAELAALWQCGVTLVAGDFLQESSQVIGQ
jgi:diguanylate cyclase (GGDEF)-like protein